MKTLLKGGMVFRDGVFLQQDVLIENGIVVSLQPDVPEQSGDLVFFLPGCHLLPGLADIHVHLREPGFSYKETFSTGTLAAARGGFTLVCAMPNVTPPPDTPEHLAVQQQLIAENAVVPVLPYGCLTLGRAGHKVCDIAAMAAGVAGFSDDGSGVQEDAVMRKAMQAAARAGALVCVHCEDDSLLQGGVVHAGAWAKAQGLPGIASASEWQPIARDIALAAETGARYHVCHVSTKEGVALVRGAKARGLKVSCETAPHYLYFCDEDLRDDGRFRMNPPIRSRADQEALLAGVADGTIEVIATDHAPHSAEEKGRGIAGSLMGVVGLETALAACYTKLVLGGYITLETLVRRMATAPRRLVGQPDNAIAVGAPLDAVAVNFTQADVVDPDTFLSLGRSTPFAGEKLYGRPLATWAAGQLVWQAPEHQWPAR
ncbi:MAG: dihydroorotase [Ruminococcaceae bacterium]|nr:dihydroorotase [Oscillospiraceae bacterium]